MPQLHEVLAAEKTATNARDQLLKDTGDKFGKGDNYFTGFNKTLKLVGDDPANEKIEQAARQDKELPTTVVTTLAYALNFWAKAEDVLASKNLTNTTALADLEFRGQLIATQVPVDELLGLEVRLGELRKLMTQMPTLDASKQWEVDQNAAQFGTWRTPTAQVTTKTEKVMTPIILVQPTDKHPAQVEKVMTDKVIGAFYTLNASGATTAIQKANVLAVLDDLIIEVKKARTRANSVEVQLVDIGQRIVGLIMEPLYDTPVNNVV